MGGIYFDTDMEVTKNIDDLFISDTFLGIEDTGYVAVGVWYEKNKNALLPTELLKIYKNMPGFDIDKMADFSIPKLISNILNDKGLEYGSNEIQKLDDSIYIYPRDYFYPYSYNRDNNKFTDNTRMIHYYDASWIPLKERIENGMVRRMGTRKTYIILEIYRRIMYYIRKLLRILLFPVIIYRKVKQKRAKINDKYKKRITETVENIKKYNNADYIVLYNKEWLGVTSATKELFTNIIDCGELYRNKDVKTVGDTILNSNINQVIFSSFAIGDKELVKYLKKNNNKIKIKTYWHGSHSQVLDSYGWERNKEIIELHKHNYIDVMASCKESLQNFYKNEGFNSYFLTNKVTTNVKPENKKSKKEIRIGLYAAKCDDWRKNMFSQMAAVSLIDNAVLDMVTLNDTAKEFDKTIGLNIDGVYISISCDEFL